ncbi:iron complex transport system substrate-binding protein [Aminobacter lissarensis]|uniref:Iron complex transport system substrate-binding protein n=1 Tax=Aminobacter carboxidus TaxID=376165 RepID=A0A8E2BFF2_9HYPH|nr:ABC transporter substrate-binding protein [Aminobacter lissarensis]MBB6469389.1 iron complex transport system substrate-binding protein [Aminobacter lissarensis]
MSLNVCTDQLVLELADPAQIVSLSTLSDDSGLSYLYRDAAAYPKNRGLAEEVFVARPDVVVTGTYSLHNTTDLLKHLGIAVDEFGYTQTLDTIPSDIRRMGSVLHQSARAEMLAAAFEQELERLSSTPGPDSPSAIIFEQNGIVLGADTLADTVVKAAGFRNLASERGYSGMVPYPLELLVKDRPDLILLSRPYNDAPALADQIATHPALAAMGTSHSGEIVPPGSWSCGGPFTIEALRALVNLRQEMTLPARKPSG